MADDPFHLQRSTAHLLHRALGVANERFSRPPRELSLRQFAVLAAVSEHPGASQNDLVRAANIDRSTLADMVKKMSAAGLLAITPSRDDARANCVQLTARGRAALREATEDARKADEAILATMPRGKRRAFQEALQRLAHTLDEEEARAEKKRRKRLKKQAAEAAP